LASGGAGDTKPKAEDGREEEHVTTHRPYTPILATLGYVLSADGERVLLVHRTRRPGDAHLGKYNGLGGKVQPDEDVVACLRREVREESGLECEEVLLRGTVSWPGFGKHGEDWFGFVFRVDRFRGEPPAENDDGPLVWVAVARVPELPLWEGDRYFLPLVFERTSKQFHGVMPYRDGRPVSWSYSWI
jgi:8-oxo-dGTP diphosphatase